MIARTETAIAHNSGQTGAYKEAGLDRLLVFDGDNEEWGCECPEVNEKVCSIGLAEGNSTAHPSCVRAFAPLPYGEDAEIELE